MKIERTETGYCLQLSTHETDLVVAGLMAYEQGTLQLLSNMGQVGATKENSLGFQLRQEFCRQAVCIGKQISALAFPEKTAERRDSMVEFRVPCVSCSAPSVNRGSGGVPLCKVCMEAVTGI